MGGGVEGRGGRERVGWRHGAEGAQGGGEVRVLGVEVDCCLFI